MTQEGHSQFPSALNRSVYSELWETDEALCLLILQGEREREGGVRERERERERERDRERERGTFIPLIKRCLHANYRPLVL